LARFFQLINQKDRRLLIIKTKIMSKLNINKNEWLELVFEGKNKAYGAYQLRQEDGSTTMKAFFGALVFIASIATLGIITSSFGDKPVVVKPTIDEVVLVTDVTLPVKEETKEEVAPVKSEPENTVNTDDLIDPIVVEANIAPNVDLTQNTDLRNNSNTNTSPTGNPNGPETGTNTTVVAPVENPDAIKTTAEVEKNPMYPGGIGEFLRIVGNRFVAPEMEEDKTVRILVYFVVEKDGTLSNINFTRSPGYGLKKEAIRGLKSIKTKWEPGIYKGKPVRTAYSLPIIVKMQQL